MLNRERQRSVNEELKKKTAGQYQIHRVDLNAHIQQIVSVPKQPLNLFNPLTHSFLSLKSTFKHTQCCSTTYIYNDSTFEICTGEKYCNNEFYICALKQDANEKISM